MTDNKDKFIFKIVVVGDAAVGKTSLIKKFTQNTFQEDYIQTIGAQLSSYEDEVNGDKIELFFWDIAGQDTFIQLRPTFYQGAVGALLVFDVTRPETFENVNNWMNEVSRYHQIDQFPIILIGNKIDLRESTPMSVSTLKGENFTRSLTNQFYNNTWNIPYVETSAKTGENVENAFIHLSKASIEFYRRFKAK